MRQGVLFGTLVFMAGVRISMLIRFWRLPNSLAPGKFFGLPLDEANSRPLLHKYHRLILIGTAIEICCATCVYLWSGLQALFVEQIVGFIAMRIFLSLAGIHIIRLAKQAAPPESWKPVRKMALLLTVRRLRDYVDLRFEILLPLLTLAGFFSVIFALYRLGGEDSEFQVAHTAAFGLLALYLQLGGLLIKHSLVKWRWRMPGTRTDDYLRWREAVLRHWLWVCDYFRLILSVALLSLAGISLMGAAEASDKSILLVRLIIAGCIIVPGIFGYERQQTRLKPLWKALTPLEDFSLGVEPIDPTGSYFGGIFYWNAENPALFVPGPFVYAVNFANRRAFLFAAYVAILVPLAIWCGCAPQRAQGADDRPLSQAAKKPESPTGKEAISQEALDQVSRGVQQLIEDDEAVGAEVLILHHRKVVFHKAFGLSDLDRKTPLEPNTIACVRSMTKPLVGTAIQMLIDEGKLSLKDRASKFLPAFDNEKSKAITVEQLLTHTAGFPLTHISKQLSGYSGQSAVADQIGQLGPKTPPGKFVYSDCDSETLAAIVAAIAGEPADEFIRKRILEPLQMRDTFCVLGKDLPVRSRVSSNHAGTPGLWHKYWDRDEKPFFPFFLGAASAYSTTQDYAKFLALWLDDGKVGDRRLLSEAAIERALKPAMPMLMPGTEQPYPTGLLPLKPYYGLHWMVYVDPKAPEPARAVRAFGHDGSDGTMALVFPQQDLMAFYFTQSRGGMSVFRFEELLAPLVGLPAVKPLTRLTEAQLEPYLGRFQEEGTGRRIWVTKRKNRLMLELSGGAGALIPHSPDAEGHWAFGEAAPGVGVSFSKSATGAVTEMQLLMNQTPIRKYTHRTVEAGLPDFEHLMQFMHSKQGGDHIEALHSLELDGSLRAGAVLFESKALAAGTTRAIRRLTSPAVSSTTVVDGATARRKSTSQGLEELHGLFREETLRINPLLRLQDWRKVYSNVQVICKEKLGDEEVWVVRLTCEFTPPVTRYVSTKRGLLLKEETWTTSKGIGTVPLTVTFEDYKEVAGVLFPYRTSSDSRLTGKQVTEVKEAKANVPVTEKAFQIDN